MHNSECCFSRVSALLALLFLAADSALTVQAEPKTITAADCDLASVQAAVNTASDGDTVQIPAGSATWLGGLRITNKCVSLVGAGTNATIITDGWTSASSSTAFIYFGNTGPGFFRVSGFTIKCDAGAVLAYITMQSATNTFRADHIVFTNLAKGGINPVGWTVGVIDHCAFYQRPGHSVTAVRVWGEGDYSWTTRPPTWGDTNKLYVEDCVFSFAVNANGAVDSYTGGRFCFRYNWCTNINVGCHGFDSTGTASTHSYEVYGNYFTNSTTGNMLMMHFRGGTGLVFSNRMESHYIYNAIALANYRCSGTNIYVGTTPCCSPVSGTNRLDGNADQYGYPAFQSIGRTSPLIYVSNSPSSNGLANAYTIQAYSPAYQWSNTLKSHILGTTKQMAFGLTQNYTNVAPYDYIPSAYWLVQSNRDYFDYTPKPGYVPLPYPHPFVTKSDKTPGTTLPPPSALRVAEPGKN